MRDLSDVTHQDFEACLSQSFTVKPDEGDCLEFELIEVKQRGVFDPEMHTRQAFSVLFRGPDEPLLPQRLYRVENATLGTLDLFLVPVGPDKHGMRYEATFA